MDFDEIYLEMQERMDKAFEHVLHEFNNIHTGKATPAMIENIQVYIPAYDSSMALREIGAITSPDARTLSVQPWDKGNAAPIANAIRDAGLGLNPISRGASIIVPVPELSGDRRRELAKMTGSHAEDGRVQVRQARQFAMDGVKKMKGEISDDDIKRHEKDVQDATDETINKINEALKEKENDLLTV